MLFLPKRGISLPSWTKERSFLAFFLLSGFTLGSYFSFYLKRYYLLPLFLILLVAFLFFSSRKGKAAFLCFAISFSFAFALNRIPLKEESKGYCELTGIVIETKANYFLFRSEFSSYYVYEKETEREIGDILCLKGVRNEVKETTYEGRFSFKEYLLTRGVKYSLSIKESASVFDVPIRLRHYEKRFLSSFSSDTSSLIDSLLFDKRNSKDEFVRNTSSLGILYLFSSSGIYLSLFISLVGKILANFLSKRKSEVVTLVFLGLLSPFNIAKVGFWRVFVSRSISLLFAKQENGIDALGRSSLTGLTLLAFSYRLALRSAFLIGIGLMLNNAFTYSCFSSLKRRKKRFASFFSFRLFLLPISIEGGSYHLFSIAYASLLPFIVFPFLLLCSFSFLSVPFPFLNGYASFLLNLLKTLKAIDLQVPIFGDISEYAVFFYYVCYYAFFYFYRIGFHKFALLPSCLYCSAILLQMLPISNSFSGEVSFLNVGQGDALIVRDHHVTVMIDTGGTNSFDIGEEVDVPYLRRKRIYKLDALILTHGDNDHDGGVNGILNNFTVDKVIRDASSFPLTVGNMLFTNLNTYEWGSDENANSLVIYLEHIGKRWLFMGDAPNEVEKRIMEDNPTLRCDILKVGHHGSDTSSSLSFLKQVSPKEAIISVGASNAYKHPSSEIINRLLSLGIKIRRTDIEGTITYKEFY